MAFITSVTAFVGSATFAPVLTLPFLALSAYTAQKFLNVTMYKSYKDLAFIVKRKANSMKIYQDVIRPDLFRELQKLNIKEKYAFLQLQALVRNVKI